MLTHARAVAADGGLEPDFEALRQSVLAPAHDLGSVVADIAEIRRQRRGRDDPWHVTDLPGGILEIELAANFLQLAGAAPEAGGRRARRNPQDRPRTRRDRHGRRSGARRRRLALAEPRRLLPDDLCRRLRSRVGDRGAAGHHRRDGVERFEGVPGRILGTARRSAKHVEALRSG